MQAPKKRIHLDRIEILAVFLVLVLSHGLLYVLGVLTGFGMHPQTGAGPELSESSHEVAENISEHGKSEAHRGPASVEASGEGGGADLKKAFRDSKQQAFVEMYLKKDFIQKPKSVAAAEAHLDSHPDWDRKPASASDANFSDNEAVNEAAKPKDADKTAIGKLFERKPSSIDRFEPRPGNYTVQIASYATEEEAQAKVSQLRTSTFNEAYIIEAAAKQATGKWYRVAVGSFASKEWAKKTGDTLVHRKLAHDFIVKQVP